MTGPRRDQRRAADISDGAVKRQATVTIGDITGRLEAIMPVGNVYTFILVVGGARAFFQLDADAIVEVHHQDPSR